MKTIFASHLTTAILFLLGASMTVFTSCGNDDNGNVTIANEITLSGDPSLTVVEGDETSSITVTYNFAAPSRSAGTVSITATSDDLTHGTNYTTEPAEENNVITVSFSEGDASLSFIINIIDDQLNLPDGSVTFAPTSFTGEAVDIPASGVSFTLTVQDNEGESITPESLEVVQLGEVIPGTNSTAQEIAFSTINIVGTISAMASTDFEVSDAVDGTFGTSASLDATATSVFVRASPEAAAALGAITGTLTLSAGDASVDIDLSAFTAESVGTLFWAEYFDYPIDETYPAYSNDYPKFGSESISSWGIVPVSSVFRAAAAYNGADGSLSGTGLQRAGFLDTWYTANRQRSVAMGNGPLAVSGYPGSGTGRTALLALDYSNQSERNDCRDDGAFLSKNTFIARRFVENGSEITSGEVYLSAMIRVNSLGDEATPTLKNAIMMLTGDASFVNKNAMKINIQDDGSGGFNFGVSKSSDDGSAVYGNTSYTIGTTYAVVLKVEIEEDFEGQDPNDVLSLYVFADGETIPDFEDTSVLAPEVQTDQAYNQNIDVFDVDTDGLEIFYTREVGDVFNAGGLDNIDMHGVEFSGIRVATSWTSLFLGSPLYDNVSADPQQTFMHGNLNCADVNQGPPNNLGNRDQ
ncbi:MAG: hypothetical protein AAF789_01425 [Bacteroidota bacterium]